MSETMYSLDRDLSEAQAMVNGLDAYVRGSTLYGSTSGGMFGSGGMPSLTVGALLMRLRRLHALEDRMNDSQRDTLAQIESKHDAVRREWSVHYHQKLTQEAASRLKAMTAFFDECADRPRTCGSIYLPEALRRTIVQEILDAMQASGTPSDELSKEARRIDAQLRRFTQPSLFDATD